jgi:hypothetical protein
MQRAPAGAVDRAFGLSHLLGFCFHRASATSVDAAFMPLAI